MAASSWLGLAALVLTAGVSAPRSTDLRFRGACDGSAAAVLPDGRIAVADDEHSLLHVYPPEGGAAEERDLRPFLGFLPGEKDEADLEGAARVGDRIYWIGSHSRNKNGKPRPERQVLFATSADASLTPIGSATRAVLDELLAKSEERDAGGALTAIGQAIARLGLANLAARSIGPEAGGINIEAIAAGPEGSLLIGFRSPRAPKVRGSQMPPALVIPLLDPKEVVETGARPRFGAPVALDLGGLGVRDMVRRADGSYAIIAGPTDDRSGFALYSWSGRSLDRPRRLTGDLSGLRPEAVVEQAGGLLLLSDDGDDACKAAVGIDRSFAGRWVP